MDEYGNEIEIIYDEDGTVLAGSIRTVSGKEYNYTVAEMEGSASLIALLEKDGIQVDRTIYAQKSLRDEFTQEEIDWIEKHF